MEIFPVYFPDVFFWSSDVIIFNQNFMTGLSSENNRLLSGEYFSDLVGLNPVSSSSHSSASTFESKARISTSI